MFSRLGLRNLNIGHLLQKAARTGTSMMSGGTVASSITKKRPLQHSSGKDGFRQRKVPKREIRGGPTQEDVLNAEIVSLMEKAGLGPADVSHAVPLQTEVDVVITNLSSTGEGLGRASTNPSEIFVVPFAIPGDVVRAKAYKNFHEPMPHTIADFVRVLQPSPDRDDKLVRCKYFEKCSGCQYQMLPYQKQLNIKRSIIEEAFAKFSNLPSESIPVIGEVKESPLQYGFRTKLTPHFDGPPNRPRHNRKGRISHFESTPPIGFMEKGTRTTLDIEECPIGSDVLQLGMKAERSRVAKELSSYSKGATILLRESTQRLPRAALDPDMTVPSVDVEKRTVYEEKSPHVHVKTCITDNKAVSTEYVDDFEFKNPAGSFFQNNNSILPSFTAYIRAQVSTPKYANLIDAYCGSGLFSITLASLFTRTIGIDIDARSIESAEKNMQLNAAQLPAPEKAASRSPSPALPLQDSMPNGKVESRGNETFAKGIHFIAADAAELFASVKDFNPAETAVILDPPRKGCDTNFLSQLLSFAPERIVYVSCNVHTQARDIGWLLRRGKEGGKGDPIDDPAYKLDSLIGFDFFPQTSHVEGVAVLTKRRKQSERE